MAANDNRFFSRLQHGDLIRAGIAAMNGFQPNQSSVLTEDEQTWFCVRDSVSATLAQHTSGTIGVAELRRAKMVADHLCGELA